MIVKMRELVISVALAITMANGSLAETVCNVHDGDTFRLCNGQWIRIWGIDAPELDQPLGLQSRDFLTEIIAGHNVKLLCNSESYQRHVCLVQLHHQDVGLQMIRSGFAYESPKYSGHIYSQVEALSRSSQAGIWGLPGGGIRPWDYRKNRIYEPVF